MSYSKRTPFRIRPDCHDRARKNALPGKEHQLIRQVAIIVTLLAAVATSASASSLTAHMQEGNPSLQSAGPLTFGPDGILFIGDTKAASVVAIATGDKGPVQATLAKVDGINQKIAALLGTTPDQILIDDMAVNPASRRVYLSVSRGRGPDAMPALVRINGSGQPELVALEKVKFSRAALPDAPADALVGQAPRQSNPRRESITDLAYHDGRVLVAGLANEEFASTLRAIPFPFNGSVNGTTVEIYHGAHGRFETRAPVRTFVPYKLGSENYLIAAYTCTPLVQFPLSEIKPGAKIKGKTLAELGNRNRPLDMVVYQKDGKNYLLLANSSRGVMKIPTDGIASAESIETPVPDKKGLGYETLAAWTGVDQLDRLDAGNVVVLRRAEDGTLSLESMPLP